MPLSNYDNIREYSNICHIISQCGGVDAFLKSEAEKNRLIGIAQERQTEYVKIPLAFIMGGGICACINAANSHLNNHNSSGVNYSDSQIDDEVMDKLKKEFCQMAHEYYGMHREPDSLSIKEHVEGYQLKNDQEMDSAS